MRVRYFYGWNVVGATFVMALGSFGLGFYGIAVYVAARIYRTGLLMYGKRPSMREVVRWVKEAK